VGAGVSPDYAPYFLPSDIMEREAARANKAKGRIDSQAAFQKASAQPGICRPLCVAVAS